MAKKYDISFGIYDVEAQDWITEDEEHEIEYEGDRIAFNSFIVKIANIIETHEEKKAEDEFSEDEEHEIEEAEKETEN